MSIESVIETLPVANWVSVGNVTGIVGSPTITGSGFNVTFVSIASAQVLMFTDDNGRFQTYTVKSRDNDTTLTLDTNLKTAVSANAGFTQDYLSSPWFMQPDPLLAKLRPDRCMIYGFGNHQMYGGQNFLAASGAGDYEVFRLFSKEEGILLKSLYITLPYQYTLGMTGITLEMRYTDTDGISVAIDSIGTKGRFQVPVENQEIEINQYVPVPNANTAPSLNLASGWSLSVGIMDTFKSTTDSDIVFDITSRFGSSYPSVSRVVAPDSADDPNADLDNTFLPIRIGARVVHIKTLTVASNNQVSVFNPAP